MSGVDPYPVIQAGGFTAHVDAFAVDPDPDPTSSFAERRRLAWPAGPPPGTDRAWPRQLADRTTPTSRSADC